MPPPRKPPRDYLIFALDVPDLAAAEHYLQLVGDQVGTIKVGLELFVREGPAIIAAIRKTSPAAIFLDLKLHDIPATVHRTMKNLAAMKVDWTTVHCAGQRAMLKAAVEGADGQVGVLGVTVLTSLGADDILADGFAPVFAEDISRLVVQRATIARDCGCQGVVCSARETETIKDRLGKRFLTITPGIRPVMGPADDQRRTDTPARALLNGADYLVIGRPIRDAADPQAAIKAIHREIAETIARKA